MITRYQNKEDSNMKKNLFVVGVNVFIAMFLFALVANVLAGGPNPGVPGGFKATGPNLKGILVVGWKVNTDETIPCGTVTEAFLVVDNALYTGVIQCDTPEDVFLAATPDDVTKWEFPEGIAEKYNMPTGTKVKVLEARDVSGFGVYQDVVSYMLPYPQSFKHMLACEIRMSFLQPTK
jgi:hypothetical protein